MLVFLCFANCVCKQACSSNHGSRAHAAKERAQRWSRERVAKRKCFLTLLAIPNIQASRITVPHHMPHVSFSRGSSARSLRCDHAQRCCAATMSPPSIQPWGVSTRVHPCNVRRLVTTTCKSDRRQRSMHTLWSPLLASFVHSSIHPPTLPFMHVTQNQHVLRAPHVSPMGPEQRPLRI